MREMAELTRDGLELPSSMRLKLARILLDLTDFEGEDRSLAAEAAWEEEIRARIQAIKEGSARWRPAADVFADLDLRYPR